MGWRKAYRRPTVEELDDLREEVVEAITEARTHYARDRTGVQNIAVRENIEQGLLMILGTDLWWGFRDVYAKNTRTKLYLKWQEYRDVAS